MKLNLYTASMSAYDNKEYGIVTIDALVKAISKKDADEIVYNRLMENFPDVGNRYTHRCYRTSLINDLLDIMETEKYQAVCMMINGYEVAKTQIADNRTSEEEEK